MAARRDEQGIPASRVQSGDRTGLATIVTVAPATGWAAGRGGSLASRTVPTTSPPVKGWQIPLIIA